MRWIGYDKVLSQRLSVPARRFVNHDWLSPYVVHVMELTCGYLSQWLDFSKREGSK